jgi:hypothetical protein
VAQEIALRIAVRDYQDAKRALMGLGAEGAEAFAKIEAGAKRATVSAEKADAAMGGLSRRGSSNLVNVSQQLQDIVGQVSAGTDIIPTLAQQLPQLASGFGVVGASIGLGIAAVGGLLIAYNSLSGGLETAKREAEEQDSAFNALAERYGLVRRSVEELTASYGRMSDVQQTLSRTRLVDDLREQEEALESAKGTIESYIAAYRQGLEQPVQVGTGMPGVGIPAPRAADLEPAQQALDDLLANFQRGQIGAANLREEIQKLGDIPQLSGIADDLSAELAGPTEDAENYRASVERLRIELKVLSGDELTEAEQKLYNQAEALKAAQAAASTFADVLGTLRAQAAGAGNELERLTAQNLERARVSQLLPEDQPFAETDIAIATEGVEAAKRREQDQKEAERRQNDLRKLRDDVAAARTSEREQAAVNAAQRLGEGATATEIAEAKRLGAALYDLRDARKGENEAKRESEKRGEFARQVQAEAAEAQRLSEAIGRGTEAYKAEADAIKAEMVVRRQKIDIDSAEGQALVQRIALTNDMEKATRAQVEVLNTLADIEGERAGNLAILQAANASGSGATANFGGRAGDAALAGLLPVSGGANDRQLADAALVTRIAVEGARARAEAFGEEAISLEEVRRRADFLSGYAARLEEVKDPQLREEILRRAAALDDEAQATERAADAQAILEDTRRGTADEARLTTALRQGAEAHKRVATEIKVENELRRQGINLKTQEGQALLAERVALEQSADAREALTRLMEEAQQEFLASVMAPLEDIAGEIDSAFVGVFQTLREDGKITWEEMAADFGEAFGNIADSLFSRVLSVPLNAALGNVQKRIESGQSVFGALQAQQGLGGGLLGAGVGGAIGTTATGLTGGNQQTAAIGSAAGAVLGGIAGFAIPVVGTFLGAAIGGALGGVVGGLFGGGGGENNDAFGYRFDPNTGTLIKTDRHSDSPQNRAAARQLADEALGITSFLQQQGLRDFRGPGGDQHLTFKVGNKSGIEFEDEQFDTAGDALNAAIAHVVENSSGVIGETLRAVLENTQAQSLAELKADVDFARNYERLTQNIGDFGIELLQLRDAFGEASTRARELGLDTQALADAQAEAEEKLISERERSLTDQLKTQAQQIRDYFENINAPFRQALGAFGISQGSAAPQATLRAGLAEFREALSGAAANDNNAIGLLPGLGAQVVQAARAFGGSGAEAQSVIAEVTRGLRDVLAANEQRAQEVLASIPDTMRITSADQVRTMVEQMTLTREKLDELRADVRKLKAA